MVVIRVDSKGLLPSVTYSTESTQYQPINVPLRLRGTILCKRVFTVL
ncbi:hypothetical protein BSPLISOX_602 [uncultured Gammaproteobacteria bacterium]|nr:hypothetical protein [uncultured Gammaproteobacteria bacterium]VVH66178.1 hypothetical protein BSPLISOX_602 [uncultured Gammaproteobacteria bacterium]